LHGGEGGASVTSGGLENAALVANFVELFRISIYGQSAQRIRCGKSHGAVK